MKESRFEAMARLRAANPYRSEAALNNWTQEDENALLEYVIADAGRSSGEAPSYNVRPSGSASWIRIRQRRRPFMVLAMAIIVGLIGLAIFLVPSGTTSAFAAWTARITLAPASQLTAADASCRTFYTTALKSFPQVSLPPALPPVVLADSRGPFELFIYGSSASGICLWHSGVIFAGDTNGGTLPPASNQAIGLPSVGFAQDVALPVTYAFGHAGSEVTGVTLNLDNGIRVQATVQNGLYAAWWPSKSDVSSAEITTPSGTAHQDFGDVGPKNPTVPFG